MNKLIGIFVFFIGVGGAVSDNFTDLDMFRKEQVVKNLSEAIVQSDLDIIIFQARVDEPFRNESKLPGKMLSTLNLQPVRYICSLNADISLSAKDVIYIYCAQPRTLIHTRYVENRVFRAPVILSNDGMWIAFVRKTTNPIVDLIQIRTMRYKDEMEQFVNDGHQMTNTDFMKRYDLVDTYTSRVFEIYKNCAFRVEHPPLDWPETKLMKMNKHLLDPMKQGAIRKQEIGNPLWLTDKEVSEIVRLSHAACSDSRLEVYKHLSTQTVSSEDRIETKIAEKLLEALVIVEEEKESKELIYAREKGVLRVK